MFFALGGLPLGRLILLVSWTVTERESFPASPLPGKAVAEFRRHRPDITLMDLRLPGTNGIDTLIQDSW